MSGCAPRCRTGAGGRWRTLTFLAALGHDRIDAPCVLDGPNFLAYVEQLLAKLKTPRRKADERTVEETWRRIGQLLDIFGPQECRKDIANPGYGSS